MTSRPAGLTSRPVGARRETKRKSSASQEDKRKPSASQAQVKNTSASQAQVKRKSRRQVRVKRKSSASQFESQAQVKRKSSASQARRNQDPIRGEARGAATVHLYCKFTINAHFGPTLVDRLCDPERRRDERGANCCPLHFPTTSRRCKRTLAT